MVYRYDIGLSKYPYGNEIEFVQASLQQLNKSFQKNNVPMKFLLNHKASDTVYDINYLDIDGTVSYQEKDTIYGGEISTRLYQNKKIDWLEIEKICQILIENKATVDDNAASQININLTPVKKKNTFMETLAKLVAIYEEEMNFFALF